MVYTIGLSLTWLLLANGCIPDIFINLVSMHHHLTAKLARHHCTFMCDVGVISMHPVWAWLCNCQTAKICARNLCQRPIHENFVLQNFLTIQYILHTLYSIQVYYMRSMTTDYSTGTFYWLLYTVQCSFLVHTYIIYLYIYKKLNEFIVKRQKVFPYQKYTGCTQSLRSMLSIV